MKKFEFMKLENAPQFIKDLIDDLPDDVEIGFKSLNLSNETLNKQSDKQPDKCENCGSMSILWTKKVERLCDFFNSASSFC